MAACSRVLDALEVLSLKGSVLLQADVYCGCELAMSALRCARVNVLVNTSSMTAGLRATELEEQSAELVERAETVSERVLNRALIIIKKEA